jgi:hypothetical protein
MHAGQDSALLRNRTIPPLGDFVAGPPAAKTKTTLRIYFADADAGRNKAFVLFYHKFCSFALLASTSKPTKNQVASSYDQPDTVQ